MNLKLLAAPVLAAVCLSAPAFSQIIDKTETVTTISVNDDQIKCWLTGGFLHSYVDQGPIKARVSIPLDSGDLEWLPVLKHWDAAVTLDVSECPSAKDIAGTVTEDGKTEVKVKRVLQKVTLPTYSDCALQRLDEKIELTLSSGKVLSSRATHALSSACDNLK